LPPTAERPLVAVVLRATHYVLSAAGPSSSTRRRTDRELRFKLHQLPDEAAPSLAPNY